MSRKEPEAGDVWKNRDNEIVYIVKVYKNTSVTGNSVRLTYKIIEYTNEESVNIMECDRDDLIKYLGIEINPLKSLFEVKE